MKFIFRLEAKSDLKWFAKYYRSVFPEGSKAAAIRFRQAKLLIQQYPLIGEAIGNATPLRELVIPRTPFSLVYYVEGQDIIVIRLLDNRAQRPAEFTA
jgi:plasmid stabilization system protein ParE